LFLPSHRAGSGPSGGCNEIQRRHSRKGFWYGGEKCGRFANEILKGTVSVNPNCTGTATVMFFESGALQRTSVLSLVFDVLSTHVRMVQKSLTLPGGTKLPVVVTVEGEKLGGD